MRKKRARQDIVVTDHGSIFLLLPTSPLGKWWLNENIDPDAQKMGDAVAVEHRYVKPIVTGAQQAGLRLVLTGR